MNSNLIIVYSDKNRLLSLTGFDHFYMQNSLIQQIEITNCINVEGITVGCDGVYLRGYNRKYYDLVKTTLESMGYQVMTEKEYRRDQLIELLCQENKINH